MTGVLLAQINLADPSKNPVARFNSLATIINLVVPVIMGIAAFGLLIMLIHAAFTVMTASGQPDNIAKAQKTISWAIAGIIFIVASYTLIRLIGYVLNIQDKLPF